MYAENRAWVLATMVEANEMTEGEIKFEDFFWISQNNKENRDFSQAKLSLTKKAVKHRSGFKGECYTGEKT